MATNEFSTPSQLRQVTPEAIKAERWARAVEAERLAQAKASERLARVKNYAGKLPQQPEFASSAPKVPGGYSPPSQPGLMSRAASAAGRFAAPVSRLAGGVGMMLYPSELGAGTMDSTEAQAAIAKNMRYSDQPLFTGLQPLESKKDQVKKSNQVERIPFSNMAPTRPPEPERIPFSNMVPTRTPQQEMQAAISQGGTVLPTPQFVNWNGETPELPPIVRGQTTQLPNRTSLVPGQPLPAANLGYPYANATRDPKTGQMWFNVMGGPQEGNWTRTEEQFQTPYTVYGPNGRTGTATFTGGRPASKPGTLSVIQGPGNAPPGSTEQEATALNTAAYNRQAQAQRELNDAYRRYQGLPTDAELAQQRALPQMPDLSLANQYYAKAQQVMENLPQGMGTKSERKAMMEFASMLKSTGDSIANQLVSTHQQRQEEFRNQQKMQGMAAEQQSLQNYRNASLGLQQQQVEAGLSNQASREAIARQQATQNALRNYGKSYMDALKLSQEQNIPMLGFFKGNGVLLNGKLHNFDRLYQDAKKNDPALTEEAFAEQVKNGTVSLALALTGLSNELPQPEDEGVQ